MRRGLTQVEGGGPLGESQNTSSTTTSTPAISVFGPLTVRLVGQSVVLAPPRLGAVFAMLLINVGKVVSIPSMVEGLWDDEPPRRAVASLQSYVSRLRRMVAGRPLPDGSRLEVRYRHPGYLLVAPPDQIDIARFEQTAQRGLAAACEADHELAFGLLGAALRAWVAPPFEQLVDYDFARAEAIRLEQIRLSVVEQRADAAFALRRDHEILLALENEVLNNPTRERLVGLLMRAQYRTGRPADALHTFERTKQLLADELGADTSPELRSMHAHILRHDPVLRGDDRVERETLTPAEKSLVPMPRRTTDGAARTGYAFFGRRGELSRLLTSLAVARAGGGHAAVVAGEAGMGKTQLIHQFALESRLAEAFIAVQCPQADDMRPYWPWAQLLRQALTARPETARDLPADLRRALAHLVPELIPTGGPQVHGDPPPPAFELHDAVRRTLHALGSRPLVLVLDDAQWADRHSLALLRFLAGQLVGAQLLLVVTFRTFMIASDPELRATFAAVLQQAGVQLVRLTGLNQAETAALANATAPDLGPLDDRATAELHHRTRGNPYFVRMLSAQLPDEHTVADIRAMVPETVREVVLERLRGLPRDVLAVLRMCAVLGPDTNRSTVEYMIDNSGLDNETLRVALRGGLLRTPPGQPDTVTFEHPLVRDIVDHELTGRTRASIYRCALISLMAQGQILAT